VTSGAGPNPGLGVDAAGNPVVDPTRNVLDLVAAAIARQDDLREAESRHVRELAELRAEFQHELRQAETERINAIRAVDVQAVQQASSVQETRATALAAQVAASAEAMRSQVAAAATAAATSLAAALEPVQKDIADLRRAQYEAQGQKTQVTETRASGGAIIGFVIGGIGVVIAIITVVALFVASPPA
jgi:cobalamin biosynthesis Mg chelatase CobN